MFHRVKSETSYDDNETQNTETDVQDAAEATEQAEVKTSTLRQQAQQTAADVTEASEPEAAEAPKQNLYQRAASTAPAASPVQQYATRPAAKPTYSAPVQASIRAESPIETTPVADEGDRRLTIGRGITMSGEIECCDYLYVEGTVEAALKGASELEIAESGVFYGTVEIENAVIAGRFEGEIIVHGSLTVESTGVITGSLSYKELSVEAGAVIDGRITPLASLQSSAQARPASRQPAKKSTSSRPANQELFSTEEAA